MGKSVRIVDSIEEDVLEEVSLPSRHIPPLPSSEI
jgi:hypothetical protein